MATQKQTDALSDSEFDKFDRLAREVLSVSHEELRKRERQWQKRRRLAKKKRALRHHARPHGGR